MTEGDDHGHPGWTGPPADRSSYYVPDRSDYDSGGLGVVYKATIATERLGLQLGTPVAVKVFTGDISSERFEKLRQRGTALKQVGHAHLARFVEAFYGPPFVDGDVNEIECRERLCSHVWVDGETLARRCMTAPALDILKWGGQAAQGLDYLHRHAFGPFAHRDIHPRNIIISADDDAVLIDFDTILVDDPRGTHTELFAPGTRFAPRNRREGIGGAQADDRWSLAKTVLFALAHDQEGKLSLKEAADSAVANLTGSVADPRGVVERFLRVLQGKDVESASALFSSLRWPTRHKRLVPRTRKQDLAATIRRPHQKGRRFRVITTVAVLAITVGALVGAELGAHTANESGAAGNRTAVLAGVSCATASSCVAVGGRAVDFNGSTWSRSLAIRPSEFLSAVSCVRPTFCTAVDNLGDAWSFNGASWSLPQNIDFSRIVQSISCSNRYFCVAVDDSGNGLYYNGNHWSVQNIDSTHPLVDVSCTDRSLCIAVDDQGDAFAFTGGPWSEPVSVDPLRVLTGVSCATIHFCTAVDDAGNAIVFTGQSWLPPREIDPARIVEAISCVSERFCIAVDNAGNAMAFDGHTWSHPLPIDPSRTLERIACVSTHFCVAVDNGGNELTFNGKLWSSPNAIA